MQRIRLRELYAREAVSVASMCPSGSSVVVVLSDGSDAELLLVDALGSVKSRRRFARARIATDVRWIGGGEQLAIIVSSGAQKSLVVLDTCGPRQERVMEIPSASTGFIPGPSLKSGAPLVMGMRGRDHPEGAVLEVKFQDATFKVVEAGGSTVRAWGSDANGCIRCASVLATGGQAEIVWRTCNKSPWRTMASWAGSVAMFSRVVALSRCGNVLTLLDCEGRDHAALKVVNCATGEATVAYEPTRGDVQCVLDLDEAGTPDLVGVFGRDWEWVGLSTRGRRMASMLRGLANVDQDGVRSGGDGGQMLVRQRCVARGPRWSLVSNTGGTGHATWPAIPALAVARPVSEDVISITARDGRDIDCFILGPTSRVVPVRGLVVLIHGGPWSRDYPGFSRDARWLADRDFMVVRVNYRGSLGYGRKFFEAGCRRWGEVPPLDIEDAVREMQKRRIVGDSVPVVMYGGSFGGFIALAVAALSELPVAGAIAVSAPSSLAALVKEKFSSEPASAGLWREFVGDPLLDERMLNAQSPRFAAARVDCPILLVHGERDKIVPFQQAEEMESFMRAAGKRVALLRLSEAGHALGGENRRYVRLEVERFISRCIGT